MKVMSKLPDVTVGEEVLNSGSHALGAILSLFGYRLLMNSAHESGETTKIVGNAIYGLSLILLYTISATYHASRGFRIKRILRYIDHCSVFLLIAGSYAPFSLHTIGGKTGFILFICVETFALVGSLLKVFFFDQFEKNSIYFYLTMGWFVIFFAKPAIQSIPPKGMLWLFIGGVLYSIGAYLFTRERRYVHFIFHLFILLGSIAQFIAVLYYS